MEITNLGEADGLPPVDWAAVAAQLDAGSAPALEARNSRTTWLATVNQDGSPHVTAVGALWLDGTFWFQTGAGRGRGAMSRAIRGARSRCRSTTRTSYSRVTLRG
jgi:Pyridoxamine 5'-phosphate oxidase